MKRSIRSSFCLFCIIIGCASAPPIAEPPAAEPATFQCPAGELQGSGFGTAEGEALDMARAELAKQASLSIRVKSESAASQKRLNGEESISSEYLSKTVMESSLQNAHNARIAHRERSGGRISISVCMSRSDAAKGFLERQRLAADSLELLCRSSHEHPGQKAEAWKRAQALWKEVIRMQAMIEGLGVANADLFNSISEIYSKAREEHIAYCRDFRLHWAPEREDSYSELAFSKLSASAKMEKSPCGKGFMLRYKGHPPECAFKFGLHSCNYKPSLSLSSCDGAELWRLDGEASGAHQKPEFALEKMRGSLSNAEFWGKWIDEVKLWDIQCE